jgi:hypothetical membrane protein
MLLAQVKPKSTATSAAKTLAQRGFPGDDAWHTRRRGFCGRVRILALGGIAGPLIFTTVTVIAGSLRPEYSHLHQFISELGATGTPYADLMNYAGFLPSGLMLLAFATSSRHVVPRSRLSAFGTVLLVCFALGVITAGVARCDVGCPQGTGSLSNLVHDRVSPLAFMALILGVGLFGLHFRSAEAWRSLWLYSVATSVLAVGLMIALIASLDSREFTGLWQRLLLGVLFAWCAAIGIRLHQALTQIQG